MDTGVSSTEGFAAFVAIAEGGSVSEAARTLAVPRATLSRQLARLEDRFGVRLAHRTSRSLTLTPAGELLFERARRILADARAAHEEVARQDDVPRGVLRVSVPAGPPGWFTALTAAFLDRYPEVAVEVVATPRLVDLVAEDVDVVIRASAASEASPLVGRVLATTRLIAVAAPGYLARRGTPVDVTDLADHECVRSLGEGPVDVWPTRDGGQVRVRGRFASNEMLTRFEAARQGLGLALVPEALSVPAEDRGDLVRVLPDVLGTEGRVRVLYADRRHLAPKIRAFVDHLFEWVTDHPPFFGDGHLAVVGR